MAYSDLADLQALGRELSADAGVSLPDAAFVFSGHQGYQVLYLIADGRRESPIYHYLEAEPGPTLVADGFLPYLTKCVEEFREQEAIARERPWLTRVTIDAAGRMSVTLTSS